MGLYALAAIGLILGASRQEWFPVFIASACVMLLLQVRMWQTNALSWSGIAAMAIFLRLIALPVQPVLSDDIFRYLWDGALTLEGINPFLFVPSDPDLAFLHDSVLFPLVNRPDLHTVYPPVSQGLFAAAAAVGGESWLRGFITLKVLLVLVELAGLYLLSRIMKPRTVMLLALSPVLLVAGAIQGHTDVLLIGLLGGAFWSWRTNRALATLVLLTLAGWVKLWPLLFVVTFLLHIAGQDRNKAVRGGLVCAGLSVLLWLPFMHPGVPGNILESLNLYVRWFEFNAGPYYLVKEWYFWSTGADWSKQIGPAFRTIFLVGTGVVWILQVARPRRLAFVLSDVRNQPWLICWGIACGYFLLSTTIHPWYVVGLILLGVVLFEDRIPWHVLLFSVLSFGTYLIYIDGPYWWAVAVAWSGPGVLWAWMQATGRRTGWMDTVLKWRAWSKMQMMRPWIEVKGKETGKRKATILDLGGAEGYVAEALMARSRYWSEAVVADVREAGRTSLAFILYDGVVLPLRDNSYDLVILSYVLHHSSRPEQVLSEALRVSRGRVIMLESVYRYEWSHRWLRFVDKVANALRSRGAMNHQQEHLNHRREEEWVKMTRQSGGQIIGRRSVRRPGHTSAVLVAESIRER